MRLSSGLLLLGTTRRKEHGQVKASDVITVVLAWTDCAQGSISPAASDREVGTGTDYRYYRVEVVDISGKTTEQRPCSRRFNRPYKLGKRIYHTIHRRRNQIL